MNADEQQPTSQWNPNQSGGLNDAYYNPSDTDTPDSTADPRYRGLNLTKGERVLREVPRHVIGVLQIYVTAVLAILGLLVATGALLTLTNKPQKDIVSGMNITIPSGAVIAVGGFLAFLAMVVTIVAVKVYYGNRLYLTNESIIQRIQTSLLHTKEQQIPLGNVEDVSFDRRGLLQQLFNYGTIRLSTEGEETTYYFYYASDPKTEVGQIIQAMEEFNRENPSTKH